MSVERLWLPRPKFGDTLPESYFADLNSFIDRYGSSTDEVRAVNASLEVSTGAVEVMTNEESMSAEGFNAVARPLLHAGERWLEIGHASLIHLVALRGDVAPGTRMRNSRWHLDIPDHGRPEACTRISASTDPTTEYAWGWLKGEALQAFLATRPTAKYVDQATRNQRSAVVNEQLQLRTLRSSSPKPRQAGIFNWRHLHQAGINKTDTIIENRLLAVTSVYTHA